MNRRQVAAADAVIRVRRERVHTTMLIELLALLIFLAMGFAILSREEMSVNPLVQRVERLEAQLRLKDAEIRALRRRTRELEAERDLLAESLRRFINDHTGTLVANDRIVLSRSQVRQVAEREVNNEGLIREAQAENQRLRRQLGRGGVRSTKMSRDSRPLGQR